MERVEAHGGGGGGGAGGVAEHLHGGGGDGQLAAHPGPLLPVGDAAPALLVACTGEVSTK